MYLRWLVLYSCNPVRFSIVQTPISPFTMKSQFQFEYISDCEFALKWVVSTCLYSWKSQGWCSSISGEGRTTSPTQSDGDAQEAPHFLLHKQMCAHPAYEKDTTEEISLPQASYVCPWDSLHLFSNILNRSLASENIFLWMDRQTHSGGGIAYSTC